MRTLVTLLTVVEIIAVRAQSNWAPSGIPFEVYEIRCMYYDSQEDAIWVGGDIRDGNNANQVLLKYDGTTWTSYGYFNSKILAVTRYQGKLIVGGFFIEFNDTPCCKLAYLNGDEFVQLDDGADGTIVTLKVVGDYLYACGNFDHIGTIESPLLARYDGASWSSVEGFSSLVPNTEVADVICFEDKFFVGGNLSPLPGSDLNGADIFFYQNGAWHVAGGGVAGGFSDVRSLVEYKGDLIIGGAIFQNAVNPGHNILKWNGNGWEELGGSITGPNFSHNFSPVNRMEVHNDLLFIVGSFYCAGDIESENITVWDGEKYCSLGGIYSGYGGGGRLAFLHDTLYMACRDSVDGQFVNNLAKYVGNWDFVACSTVDVPENETLHIQSIQLFPNPATHELNVQSELVIETMEVADLTGRVVLMAVPGKACSRLGIRSLTPGCYLLTATLEDGSIITQRFIKE